MSTRTGRPFQLNDRIASSRLKQGFQDAGYRSVISDEIVALYKGDLLPDIPTLVRIIPMLTVYVFGSLRCDCGPQLHLAMQMIDEEGEAYSLPTAEGRCIAITRFALRLQDEGPTP